MQLLVKALIDLVEIAFFLGLAGSLLVVTLTVLDDVRNIFRNE